MNNINYPNRLKELRTKNNITGEKISEMLDVSVSYYYHLEKGEKRLNEDMLHKVADYYQVSIDYILKRDNIPASEKDSEYTAIITLAKNSDITPNKLKKLIKNHLDANAEE